jgi:Iguana/Dzip1-like DAZ-interacting protein N-terminal
MNYEFVKSVRESGFSFKSHKEKIDLSKIGDYYINYVSSEPLDHSNHPVHARACYEYFHDNFTDSFQIISAHLDLDRVARDLDVSILQEHVGTLVNCDLGDLKGIDPGLVKLFHLAQLCMEYCLYCQDFLSTCLNSLESVHVETLKVYLSF